MRIAVIQLEVRPRARTATFQRALQAIDRAAEVDPAPDLIVLPAFADMPEVSTGKMRFCENVFGQTTAGCGVRARSWGVFLALGLAEAASDRPFATGILIDRDGDIRIRQRQISFHQSVAQHFAVGKSLSNADILFGRMALLVGDDLLSSRAWDAAVKADTQFIIGCACWMPEDGDDRRRREIAGQIAEQSRRCGLPCAVANATAENPEDGPRCSGSSRIIDCTGKLLAAADDREETILWADIALPDVPPRSTTIRE